MRFTVIARNRADKIKTPALAVGIWQSGNKNNKAALAGAPAETDKALGGLLSRLISGGEFDCSPGSTKIIDTFGKTAAQRIVLVGLGREKTVFESTSLSSPLAALMVAIRKSAGVAARAIRSAGIDRFALCLDSLLPAKTVPGLDPVRLAEAVAVGARATSFDFDKYKTEAPKRKQIAEISIVPADGQSTARLKDGLDRGKIIADGMDLAKTLITEPPAKVTPIVLAETAKRAARETARLTCKVLDKKQIEKLGMGGLLGVAAGSVQPPRFIIMEYKGPGAKRGKGPVVIIGKGITFDSGGLSLKPASFMEDMKTDMSGAAAVIATMRTIAKLGLPKHVVGLVPTTENMPSGSATKPGDILKTLGGKTIEVLNTDAEGRLILADALCYAERYKPAAVIDLATLTGAILISLGELCAGLFTNDDKLASKISDAANLSGDLVWRMPMWEEYDDAIKSTIADVKNTGDRYAGSITAARFLKKFTSDMSWAHIDIAGTAWHEKHNSHSPNRGATAFGVKLLVELLSDHL